MAASVARLKVVLDDVSPPVMRQIEVPLTIRLSRLHTVLQIVLGWTDSHLYEFVFGGVGFGIPDPDDDYDSPIDARHTSLRAALTDAGVKSFKYLYDFGDGWEHSIKVEKISPAIPGLIYPILLKGIGRCPPEDVGGPSGYEDFLQALNDPGHEEHDNIKSWCGGAFDSQEIDFIAIDRALEGLAKKPAKRTRTAV